MTSFTAIKRKYCDQCRNSRSIHYIRAIDYRYSLVLADERRLIDQVIFCQILRIIPYSNKYFFLQSCPSWASKWKNWLAKRKENTFISKLGFEKASSLKPVFKKKCSYWEKKPNLLVHELEVKLTEYASTHSKVLKTQKRIAWVHSFSFWLISHIKGENNLK